MFSVFPRDDEHKLADPEEAGTRAASGQLLTTPTGPTVFSASTLFRAFRAALGERHGTWPDGGTLPLTRVEDADSTFAAFLSAGEKVNDNLAMFGIGETREHLERNLARHKKAFSNLVTRWLAENKVKSGASDFVSAGKRLGQSVLPHDITFSYWTILRRLSMDLDAAASVDPVKLEFDWQGTADLLERATGAVIRGAAVGAKAVVKESAFVAWELVKSFGPMIAVVLFSYYAFQALKNRGV